MAAPDDISDESGPRDERLDELLRLLAAAPPLAPALAPGSEIAGRYVVERKLGRGGMGVVYSAHDRELERRVALKLHRTDADPRAAARMLREARAMARLAHPNVLAVHEVGEHAGQIFIAVEWVDGVDLRAWLTAERSVATILAVFVAAGEGLAAAHDAGLVHRDFKPANVLIAVDGRVRVADFGLARAAGSTSEQAGVNPATSAGTPTHDFAGTPGYMAPEQARGEPVDARSDQYSFFSALHFSQRPTARKQAQMREIAGLNSPIIYRANLQDTPTGLRGFGENQETEPGGAWRDLCDQAAPSWTGRAAVHASVESVSRRGSPSSMTTPILTLESHNLEAAERQLCELALDRAGNILEAAKLLGVTRHALKRRIIKHKLAWPRPAGPA
ncbi:MAG: protein kinase [Myxococcales bacterium]|nr:protein kinase [Myxococcales bacterium]